MIPFKLTLDGCKIRSTDVYTTTYDSVGQLYCFNIRVIGFNKDMCFRITSKSKNFHDLFSVDVLDKTQEAIVGIHVKDQNDDSSELVAKRIIYHILTGKKEVLKEDFHSIMGKLVSMIGPIMAIISILMIAYYYVLSIVKWSKTKLSDNVYENQINKKLFDGQNGKEPEFAIYNRLIKSIEMLVTNKNVKSVLVCGVPGSSKTHIVRRTLYFKGLQSGSDYIIFKGSTMSMIDFVSALYHNNGKIIILDDFDSPLNDPDLVNILKSATDSYSRRIISFPRAKLVAAQSNGAADYDIPDKFEFSGKLIIITNKQFREIDKAFISRCLTVEVNFTPEEFLKNINSMLKYIMPDIDMKLKLEVFGYVEKLSRDTEIKNLNFRTFQSAVSIRLLYPENWKEMVSYILK